MTVLFWNIHGKPLVVQLQRLVARHGVDVLVLAEAPKPAVFNQQLVEATGLERVASPGQHDKVRAYVRSVRARVVIGDEGPRFSIGELRFQDALPLTIAMAHLPSRDHHSVESVGESCREFAGAVTEYEKKARHRRTIVIGDFNLSPFDPALVSARGFHAVMDQQVALRQARTVDEKDYPFFYNPMWSCQGDLSAGPPGTYYYQESGHVAYFWHVCDQVLIAPDLLEWTQPDSVEVLTSDGQEPLLTAAGHPDKMNASDHLPLLVRLYPAE